MIISLCLLFLSFLLVCNGGIWFDLSDTRGKNTIENAQVLLLGLKLGRLQKEFEDNQGKSKSN